MPNGCDDGLGRSVGRGTANRCYLCTRSIRPTPQDLMKKNRPAIPKAAPKPGDARAPKTPIWAPRQSKAPQTHVKPRDTSQKSGQRGR